MFEIECILDEAAWEQAVRSALLSGLLALKQIRLGVPKVPGPLHTGVVGFSERVTFLVEIHFHRESIRGPSGCSQRVSGYIKYLKPRTDQVSIKQPGMFPPY